jgi:predicted metal-binding protein
MVDLHKETAAGEFINHALELGAEDAVAFGIDDIAFDPRTLLKCMFGCGDWGKNHTCPSRPGFPLPWDFERILRSYSWGVIIHSKDKRDSQKISFELEREAFLKGYYFAFSLSDCSKCAECKCVTGEDCAFPGMARPAFHSVGIDVFKTVHGLGLPLSVLTDKAQQPDWYSAVFIE